MNEILVRSYFFLLNLVLKHANRISGPTTYMFNRLQSETVGRPNFGDLHRKTF